MRPDNMRKAAVALLLVVGLAACNELVRGRIQTEIDKFWFDPVKNKQTEDDAEARIKKELDAQLAGKEFEVPGPNPYLHHVKSVRVELGKVSPKVAIPGQVTVTQTQTHYYLSFDFTADWAKDNGAEVDIGLDLRSHSFFLAYGYPDHDAKLRNITATAAGKALVVIPKAGGKTTSSITISRAEVDLTAKAEGWFWSIDVSKVVKGQVKDALVRELIGRSIELSFQAP